MNTGSLAKKLAIFALAGASFAAAPSVMAAEFEEFPIGPEKVVGPLEIGAVYFQPVDMEPLGMGGLPAAKADMHLEADISPLRMDTGFEPQVDFNDGIRLTIQSFEGK